MARPIRVRLPTGREVKFAMLSEDGMDVFVKLLTFWSPGTDFTKMEFYLSNNRIVEHVPFPQQNIGPNPLLLAIPAKCVGDAFPTMLVLTTRSQFWSLHPQHGFPIYLRVECHMQPPRYLMVETDENEKIQKLKVTINQLIYPDTRTTTSTPAAGWGAPRVYPAAGLGGGRPIKQRLYHAGTLLNDEIIVGGYELVSGTTLQCTWDP
jgi:hypothetical protein